MPKPCWAILRFDIAPGPRGSGVQYASIVKEKDILYRYQHPLDTAKYILAARSALDGSIFDE